MKQKISGIRVADRATLWQSGSHRFWYRFCACCLALYIAYAAYLSQSGLFVSGADTVAALLWFAVTACGAFWLLRWFAGLRFGLLAPEARAKFNPRVMLVATAISLIILAAYLMADYPGGVSVGAVDAGEHGSLLQLAPGVSYAADPACVAALPELCVCGGGTVRGIQPCAGVPDRIAVCVGHSVVGAAGFGGVGGRVAYPWAYDDVPVER